jgi:hypothetical protein
VRTRQHAHAAAPHPARLPPAQRYRLGLTGTALGIAGGAAAGLAGADGALDPLALLGAAGLGVSVFLIHVYVDPLKRLLQVGRAAPGGGWFCRGCGRAWAGCGPGGAPRGPGAAPPALFGGPPRRPPRVRAPARPRPPPTLAPPAPARQVLWAAGVAGGAYLALAKCGGEPVALYVAEHPWAVWLVGPYFASLTGGGDWGGGGAGPGDGAGAFVGWAWDGSSRRGGPLHGQPHRATRAP